MTKPRFSIRWLMIVVAVSAVYLWLCMSANQVISVVVGTVCLAFFAAMGVPAWAGLKENRRMAAWVLGVSSVLAFVPLAALGVFALNYLAVVYRLMVGLLFLPFLFGSGVAWAKLATSPGAEPRRSKVAAWTLVGSLFVLPVSMIFSDWPMWAAFYASRPALDRLADRMNSGETLEKPEWAGLFLVRKVRPSIQAGTVTLVVVNDSTGHTWFVRAAKPEVNPEVPPATYSIAHTAERILRGGRWWRYDYD